MRIVARGFCLSVVVLSAISSQALATAGNPVALHLTFRKVASHLTGWPVGSGRYIAYGIFRYGIQPWRFVLLDDITGKRTTMTACGHPPVPPPWKLGGPWVAFDCPSLAKRWQLYNIYTHRWRRLRCDATCRRNNGFIEINAVGDKWLALDIVPHQPCGDGIHNECGPRLYLYYNIATGGPKIPHPPADAFIDLDSPTLTSRLCSPVPSPAGLETFPPPLAFDGRFVFVQASSGIYVQGCGSTHQTYLTTNPNAWTISPFQLAFFKSQYAGVFCSPQPQPNGIKQGIFGIYLPTLTTFIAALPQDSFCGQAALGPRHLYIAGAPDTTTLLAATFPPRPPHAAP